MTSRVVDTSPLASYYCFMTTPFAHAVREARLAAGKSQGDVCRVLGVSRPFVSDVESGKRSAFSLARLLKLAQSLDADPVPLVLARAETVGCAELPYLDDPFADPIAAALSARWERLTNEQRSRISAALEDGR